MILIVVMHLDTVGRLLVVVLVVLQAHCKKIYKEEGGKHVLDKSMHSEKIFIAGKAKDNKELNPVCVIPNAYFLPYRLRDFVWPNPDEEKLDVTIHNLLDTSDSFDSFLTSLMEQCVPGDHLGPDYLLEVEEACIDPISDTVAPVDKTIKHLFDANCERCSEDIISHQQVPATESEREKEIRKRQTVIAIHDKLEDQIR
jgi:hypothetical protein